MTFQPRPEPDARPPLHARTDVFQRYTADSLLVLPSRGNALKLNGPAALVWELLNEGTPADMIASLVADAYRQDEATVEPLVRRTLDRLVDGGLAATGP